MSLSRSVTPFPVLSVVIAAALLGLGSVVAFVGYAPAWWQVLILGVCAALAAAALIVPALRAHRESVAARAERDARVVSLAEGIDTALASLHAATAEAQLLTEQNRRRQSLADELTAKLNAAADAAVEKINQAARDASGQSVQSVAQSVQAAEQSVQAAAQAAATRVAAEAARLQTAACERLEAGAARAVSEVADRAGPVERLLAELPAKITKLEALAAKIPADATAAAHSLGEARSAALAAVEQARVAFDEHRAIAATQLESAATAARAALDTAATEQAALVSAAADHAGQSLQTLAQDLEARLKTAAEPTRPAAAKARPVAPAAAGPVQLVLGENVDPEPAAKPSLAEPSPVEPSSAEPSSAASVVVEPVPPQDSASASESEPPRPEIIAPAASDPTSGPVNPVDFAGERAYDDLASAMDDALKS
ncbi:MAG: hypothetical protein ABII82_17015 [Verrucomicrobiota bacterium]